MNKKAKLLMAMAGAGIMGILTGCGTAESTEMSMQTVAPEFMEQPESNQKTVSGNNILDNLNQPFGEESVKDNTTQTGNSNTNSASSGEILPGESKQSEPTPSGVAEVIAVADSEAEAQRIAELYQIELKSFGQGVAVYTTDKDVAELIQLGKDNNYPELAPNHQIQLY